MVKNGKQNLGNKKNIDTFKLEEGADRLEDEIIDNRNCVKIPFRKRTVYEDLLPLLHDPRPDRRAGCSPADAVRPAALSLQCPAGGLQPGGHDCGGQLYRQSRAVGGFHRGRHSAPADLCGNGVFLRRAGDYCPRCGCKTLRRGKKDHRHDVHLSAEHLTGDCRHLLLPPLLRAALAEHAGRLRTVHHGLYGHLCLRAGVYLRV